MEICGRGGRMLGGAGRTKEWNDKGRQKWRDTLDKESPIQAGCRKSTRPGVCPVKAGMFNRGQTCRGRSQSPVVWIAEVMETETMKPIDEVFRGKATSHRAVTKVNALWPRKGVSRGPSLRPEGDGRMSSRRLTDTDVHLGGVEATAR